MRAEPTEYRPRGLVNYGNICYANSVLQATLACRQFYHLMSDLGHVAQHSGPSSASASSSSASHGQPTAAAAGAPITVGMAGFVGQFKVGAALSPCSRWKHGTGVL